MLKLAGEEHSLWLAEGELSSKQAWASVCACAAGLRNKEEELLDGMLADRQDSGSWLQKDLFEISSCFFSV